MAYANLSESQWKYNSNEIRLQPDPRQVSLLGACARSTETRPVPMEQFALGPQPELSAEQAPKNALLAGAKRDARPQKSGAPHGAQLGALLDRK